MNFIANRRRLLLVSSTLVAWGLMGCATGTGRSSSPYARELPLTFNDGALSAQMAASGLLPAFTRYWQAYAHRRWADRYQMERFAGDLAESFYVAYHDAAWMIQSFNVIKVHEPDDQGRVRVDIDALYRSLVEDKKEKRQLVQDWWIPHEGRWLHVNTDPMLNGMKTVV